MQIFSLLKSDKKSPHVHFHEILLESNDFLLTLVCVTIRMLLPGRPTGPVYPVAPGDPGNA